jgi:hypothetical protein
MHPIRAFQHAQLLLPSVEIQIRTRLLDGCETAGFSNATEIVELPLQLKSDYLRLKLSCGNGSDGDVHYGTQLISRLS